MKKYFFYLGLFFTSIIAASQENDDQETQEFLSESRLDNILLSSNRSSIFNKKIIKKAHSKRIDDLASSLEGLLQDSISNQNHAIQMQGDALSKIIEQRLLERNQEMKKNKQEFVDTLNVLLKKIEDLENKVEQSRPTRIDSVRILDNYSSQIINLQRSFQRLEQGVSGKLSCMENNMYALTTNFLQIVNQFDAVMKQQNRAMPVDSKDLYSTENDTASTPVLKSLTDPEVRSYNASYGQLSTDTGMPLVRCERFVKKKSSNDFNDED